MTRRERMENRAARRLDWATGREKKSDAAFKAAHRIADNIPLGQPILVGHHSERHARRDADRIHNSMSKGVESAKMAEEHRSKAAGIQDQLDRSIFSDDADAIKRLHEKIAGLEEERERVKVINKDIRKGNGWVARLAEKGIELTAKEQETLLTIAKYTPYHCDKKTGLPVFPGYHVTSLGANIRRCEERIKEIEARAAQIAKVEATESGVLVENLGAGYEGGTAYTRVTFAEKPERATLDALKAAGYSWGRGSWTGPTARLPEGLR